MWRAGSDVGRCENARGKTSNVRRPIRRARDTVGKTKNKQMRKKTITIIYRRKHGRDKVHKPRIDSSTTSAVPRARLAAVPAAVSTAARRSVAVDRGRRRRRRHLHSRRRPPPPRRATTRKVNVHWRAAGARRAAPTPVRIRRCPRLVDGSRRSFARCKWNFRRAHYTSRLPSGTAKRSATNASKWMVSIGLGSDARFAVPTGRPVEFFFFL